MSYYGTPSGATAYFETRLETDAWDNATAANRIKALSMATRDIDKLNFLGTKVSSTQVLAFPRYIDNDDPDEIIYFDAGSEVPDSIEYACYELALSLLDGKDIEQEITDLSTTVSKIGSMYGQFDVRVAPEHIVNGIASYHAWHYLRPYLHDKHSLELLRTS